MNECPSADALTTIASALEWNTERGLHHLAACANCQSRLAVLQLAHAAYLTAEQVPDATIARISDALSSEAEHARSRNTRGQQLGHLIEALIAGATAVAVVAAGGLPVSSDLRVMAFVVVASGMLVYRFIIQPAAPGSTSP